jgi:hypothetical protein
MFKFLVGCMFLFGVSVASSYASGAFSIKCDQMGGVFPAKVTGKVWFSGGGSRIEGVINISIKDGSGKISTFNEVRIAGTLDDELDYRFVYATGTDLSRPIRDVQFNDIGPSASLVTFADFSRWATNCTNGISPI